MVHAGVEKYCVILLYLTVQYQYIYIKKAISSGLFILSLLII